MWKHSKIAKRLPSGFAKQGLRAVASIERRNRESTFSDLMEFVKEVAQIVSSCYASASNWKSRKTNAVPKFNTHSTIVSKPSTNSHELCPFCSKGHKLWDCSSFVGKVWTYVCNLCARSAYVIIVQNEVMFRNSAFQNLSVVMPIAALNTICYCIETRPVTRPQRYRYTWSKNDVISSVRKHNCALRLVHTFA